MKYSDDLFDVNHDIKLASIFGLICGVASAIASVNDVGAAYICISILIGNLIALKIDGIHHIISLFVFVFICFVYGIPNLNLIILIICIIAALSDEVGHEVFSNDNNHSFLNLFFEYRFLMKIVIFLLAIFGFFDVFVFILFILFEISYEIAGIVFKNLKKEV